MASAKGLSVGKLSSGCTASARILHKERVVVPRKHHRNEFRLTSCKLGVRPRQRAGTSLVVSSSSSKDVAT
eukprot:2308585-Pyramimonas_sp.AAC.1